MQHNIINTWDEFLEMRDYLESYNSDILVIDTETDGIQEKTAKLFGFGLCLDDHEAFYIGFRDNTEDKAPLWSKDKEEQIISWLVSFCKTKKLVGWNIVYDLLIIYHNWSIDLTDYVYSDGILQKHLLDEERPFGLKEVAVKYLGEWADKAQQKMIDDIKQRGGKTTKDDFQMWKCDRQILGEYCCWDVLLTRKLFDIFEPRIKAEGLYDLFYKDEIMPLYKEVTIPMKKYGFNIDVAYFKELGEQISNEMATLEQKIQRTLHNEVLKFEQEVLDKEYPIKRTGSFPKMYAQMINFALPQKNGKITLAAKEIEKLDSECKEVAEQEFLSWIRGSDTTSQSTLKSVQRYWYKIDNVDSPYIFNLNSNDHLKWLFFDHYDETPLNKTDSGKPQVDEAFLDSMAANYTWVQQLIDYKKLQKLKSTYVEGVLDRHVDGIIHTSMLQFGPPTGRYASRDPNLQNLPRVKEDDSGLSERVLKYTNSIRAGFVAPKGYKLVDADQSQLEPRAFAGVCGDKKLVKSFIDGEDLYGSIACNIWGLDCKANEVKKKYPERRQQSKVVALAVVYGAEAGRISKLMDINYMDAQDIINDYLNAYPGLKSYMSQRNEEVCTTGQVKSKFGRIRHLPEAQSLYRAYGLKLLDKKWAKSKGLEELSWKFKSMLNLAKNFPIQAMAAHVMNRSAVNIMRQFKLENIDGYIALQIHDQIICIVKEEQALRAKEIVKQYMETSVDVGLPLIADPNIADNMKDSH